MTLQMAQVRNIGLVSSIEIPRGWIEQPQRSDLFRGDWRRSFHPVKNDEVEMMFLYRGSLLDAASASEFQSIIRGKTAEIEAEKLTPQEICKLQFVMGYETAGNNQYSNPTYAPDSHDGPVFDLVAAMTRMVSTRTVLYVRGSFKSGKEYAGIFYPSSANPRMIEEFAIQAPDKILFGKFESAFDSALESISWCD